jgi:hypothetical protein
VALTGFEFGLLLDGAAIVGIYLALWSQDLYLVDQ